MSVEAGPSGAVGLVGIARLPSGQAPVAVGEFPTIVNEGPVSLSALENTMTIAKFNTTGEIVFKPSGPSVIEQAEAVAAKVWEAPELDAADAIAEAQVIISEAAIVPNVIPAWVPDHFTQPVVIPQVEPVIWPVALPKLDYQPAPLPVHSTVSHQAAPAVSPQPLLQEQEVEKIVTEKNIKDEMGMIKQEKIEQIKKKYVVDERALSQVLLEIKAAARKAGVLAGKLGIKITGKLIGKFLPGQHPGNESEAVKGKGPDGSIPERQQTIEEQGEYISAVQAEANAVKVAYEKPPIKIRSEGEPVKDEDVDRVFRPYDVKPVAHEILIKKVVKKKVQVSVGQAAVEPKAETSLEDYPELAEVFQKAA